MRLDDIEERLVTGRISGREVVRMAQRSPEIELIASTQSDHLVQPAGASARSDSPERPLSAPRCLVYRRPPSPAMLSSVSSSALLTSRAL